MAKTKRKWLVLDWASDGCIRAQDIPFNETQSIKDKIDAVVNTIDSITISENPWITKTTDYTATANDKILADSSSAAFTITLPASPSLNDVIEIADIAGQFSPSGSKNVTVARNSKKIMGEEENLVLDSNCSITKLIFYGDTLGWRVF